MKYFFSSNFKLKERKRKTEKEILPPNPLLKEKEKKEKEEKTTLSAGRALSLPLSDLEKRLQRWKTRSWRRSTKRQRRSNNRMFFNTEDTEDTEFSD